MGLDHVGVRLGLGAGGDLLAGVRLEVGGQAFGALGREGDLLVGQLGTDLLLAVDAFVDHDRAGDEECYGGQRQQDAGNGAGLTHDVPPCWAARCGWWASHHKGFGSQPVAGAGEGLHFAGTNDLNRPGPFGPRPTPTRDHPPKNPTRWVGHGADRSADRAPLASRFRLRRLRRRPRVRAEGPESAGIFVTGEDAGGLFARQTYPVQIRMIRVFLLDDHEVVRRGLADLLQADGDIEVVGESGSAAEATARIPALRPDVAVLDARLPDGNGIDVCRDVRAVDPSIKGLILTSYEDDEALFAAIMAGAAGYVLKQIRGTDLVDAVRRVAAGQSLLDPAVTARVLERIRHGIDEPEELKSADRPGAADPRSTSPRG